MAIAIVSGAIANKPWNGGAAWTRLNWALGLRRLGWTVYFIEQLSRRASVDARGAPAPEAQSANLAYFRRVMGVFGFSQTAALLDEAGHVLTGPGQAELESAAEQAGCLLNITGHLQYEPLLRRIRYKAYIDLDPGFTQFWHADARHAFRLKEHDAYLTVGHNIGTSDCAIPTEGIPWRPIRQPVVLDEWPLMTQRVPFRFTTIASWRGPYGVVESQGRALGLKVHEFRRFLELPQHCAAPFELALDIHPNDRRDAELLHWHGWKLVDPKAVAGDPEAFRRYVQGSGAECSVAQHMYVETNSGWFSDRTVRYLASGRPALVQETGFSRHLPSGEGLVAFRTFDQAVDGAERIQRDYTRHSRAARAIAEEYFDSDKVLGRLLDEIGVSV